MKVTVAPNPLGKAIVSHFKNTSNITLSMLLNFIAIILAMVGILNPVTGALVHNIGSAPVIINSALLLNFKSKYF